MTNLEFQTNVKSFDCELDNQDMEKFIGKLNWLGVVCLPRTKCDFIYSCDQWKTRIFI